MSTTDKIKVTLTFYSQAAVNSVVPGSLTVTPTGGASASCGSPTLTSPDANVGGPSDPAIYEWTCTATAGATPGSLTFSASATGSGGATYPSASSKSVLVSPTLTFQATVNAGAPAVIENTGHPAGDQRHVRQPAEQHHADWHRC